MIPLGFIMKEESEVFTICWESYVQCHVGCMLVEFPGPGQIINTAHTLLKLHHALHDKFSEKKIHLQHYY